jgi:hypothetical protein
MAVQLGKALGLTVVAVAGPSNVGWIKEALGADGGLLQAGEESQGEAQVSVMLDEPVSAGAVHAVCAIYNTSHMSTGLLCVLNSSCCCAAQCHLWYVLCWTLQRCTSSSQRQ